MYIIHLKIIGIALMLLAFIHVGFPKKFNWSNELKHLSLLNRQMMQTHTFFIALTVFLMGLLCFTKPKLLSQTELGKMITLGLALFWFIRLIFQLFVYSPKLWKGKTFETSMHIIFTLLWMYLATIFFIIYFKS